MHFLPESIQEYCTLHSQPEPELLQRLARETGQKVLQPRMLSGHYQGRVLSLLSKIVRPKTILEIGTYTGYSALCLAEGLSPDGQLYTIDKNEELETLQKKYFGQSDFASKIQSYVGDALSIIPQLETTFDLVFIDADKPNYVNYFHLIINKLNPGGVLLSDNVLWSGKVVEKVDEKDESTRVLLEYNRLLNEDPRVETVLLPIRDGLTLTRKK